MRLNKVEQEEEESERGRQNWENEERGEKVIEDGGKKEV